MGTQEKLDVSIPKILWKNGRVQFVFLVAERIMKKLNSKKYN